MSRFGAVLGVLDCCFCSLDFTSSSDNWVCKSLIYWVVLWISCFYSCTFSSCYVKIALSIPSYFSQFSMRWIFFVSIAFSYASDKAITFHRENMLYISLKRRCRVITDVNELSLFSRWMQTSFCLFCFLILIWLTLWAIFSNTRFFLYCCLTSVVRTML